MMFRNLVLFAIVALSFCAADEDDVLVLTDENFDSTLEANDYVLVEFYAPWCGHCKKLEPEYAEAATALKGKFVLGKVDATVESDLAQSYGVRGYPTLKVFKNGKPKEYNGGRTAADIVSYCEKQLLPALTFLETEESVTEFQSKGKVVVVGFFESKEAEEFIVFEKSANLLRDDFVFGAVIGSGVAEKFEAKAPGVVLFKTFDEGKAIYDGKFEAEAINEFVETQSVPLFDEIGPENYQTFVQTGLPLGFVFLSGGQDNDAITETFVSLAKKYKGKVNLVWIDFEKYESQAGRLGLSGNKVPAFAIDSPDPEASAHYAYDEEAELSEELVDKWLAEFVEGKLAPTVKSEEIPESNDEDVKVVVGKQFDEIVLDETKDVLIEFYAPWCGHCKKLAPTFDEVGATFKDEESIVIAKMDATANDVDPKYKIRGFPTIKFFPAGDKANPMDYEDDREHADFVKFVNKHRTPVSESTEGKDEL